MEVITELAHGFPYFLQLKSEFGNQKLMIWARVSSRSSFLLTVYSFSIFICKERNQSDFGIDHLVRSLCSFVSGVVGWGCLLWLVHSLGKTLLAFALHFILYSKSKLTSNGRYLLTSCFCIPVPYDEKDNSFCFRSWRSCSSSVNHTTSASLALLVAT